MVAGRTAARRGGPSPARKPTPPWPRRWRNYPCADDERQPGHRVRAGAAAGHRAAGDRGTAVPRPRDAAARGEDEALEGMKFSECLPRPLALHVLGMRGRDPPAVGICSELPFALCRPEQGGTRFLGHRHWMKDEVLKCLTSTHRTIRFLEASRTTSRRSSSCWGTLATRPSTTTRWWTSCPGPFRQLLIHPEIEHHAVVACCRGTQVERPTGSLPRSDSTGRSSFARSPITSSSVAARTTWTV